MKNLTNILDRAATELEARGLRRLAAELDVVSNTLDRGAGAWGPGDFIEDIKDVPHQYIKQHVKAAKKAPAVAAVAVTECEVYCKFENSTQMVKPGGLVLSGLEGELWSPGKENKEPLMESEIHQKYRNIQLSHEELQAIRKKKPNALPDIASSPDLRSGNVRSLGYVMVKDAKGLDCYQISVPFKVKVNWDPGVLECKAGAWYVEYGANDKGSVINDQETRLPLGYVEV